MKGIILAGGTGSRLWPITRSTSKQLLPIFDKPMIHYPMATLMLAGIREILIITTPHDLPSFQKLLGDGEDLGIKLSFETQSSPNGLAEAFIIGETFLGTESCMMVLGDNIFHGVGLGSELAKIFLGRKGAHIFTYEVADPSQYGVLSLGIDGNPLGIIEKPISSKSNLAVTGLYCFDNKVASIARAVTPSARGELEITSVIDEYLKLNELEVTKLSRGSVWLDTGNPSSLHDAASYVRVIEERSGLKIGCIEEIAWRSGWIDNRELETLANNYGSSEYAKYLRSLLTRL